ncbi:hypothetical protein ACWD7Y_14370 [Streptomyces drozdowiczii]
MPYAKALPLLEPADGQGVVRCFPSLTEHPMTDRAAPLPAVGTRTPVWVVAVLIAPVGLGGGLAVPALTAMLLDAVPSTDRAPPGPYSTSPGQVGGAIAVAVFGALPAGADPP